MLYCKKCNIRAAGTPKNCPLCQGDLAGTPDESGNVFPVIPPVVSPYRTLINLIAFGTVIAAAASIAVNISVPFGGWWSLFVVAGLGSLWLSFLLINKWKNIPKNIFKQVIFISVLALAWDFFTGFNGWSLNFVLPILFSFAMVALAVYAKIMKLGVEDYTLYLLIISVMGVFSLLLILFDVVTIVYPAAVCFALSVISIGSILLFEGKALWKELQRRLHL
ncbi:DUF6320 domain-containing protein [Breznakiella homolactica]|uniref:Uncharacterized protein n=1 Tax=Breznakiella homolactica TaxID=2798577 RepID=A0A7T7XMF0_9SPIR|nr:DUF6320 domain-containing protein [Breznakiella homolactica]QQO09061.1 DUF6320 domain-containing protein [Breznakiella homolactica]